MMLAIQRYLRANSLQAAVDEWAFRVQEHGSLVQLNYSSDSSLGVQEIEECRGLILSKPDWDVVAYPFYRFYNEGESYAACPDLSSSVLLEKLDGSLITLYWNPELKDWCVATRGTILADATSNWKKLLFQSLFWQAVRKYLDVDFERLPKTVNLMFELIGPDNRVLTWYPEADLRLLAARDLTTLEELDDEELDGLSGLLGIPRPKVFSFFSREDVLALLDTLDEKDEGFVLVDYDHKKDGNFLRIKVKNKRYLELAYRLHAGQLSILTPKNIIRMIRSDEVDEMLAYFPEFGSDVDSVRQKLGDLAAQIDRDFESVKHLGIDRKELAKIVGKMVCPKAIFWLLDGKLQSGRQFLMTCFEKTLFRLLGFFS